MKLQAYRVACPQHDFSVSREPIWCHLTAVPRALASPGSSSHELYLSYRVSTTPNLPRTRVRDASLGVLLPIATSAERVHLRASIPSSPYGPPSAFLTPSTASSSSCLAGLFHPAATSGIHLPGVFLPLPSQNASSAPRALLSVCGCRLPPSCLGGASSTRPASRALIRAAIRSHRQGD